MSGMIAPLYIARIFGDSRIVYLASDVDAIKEDADTLRGYIDTHGETPAMTWSNREHWKKRAERAEARCSALVKALSNLHALVKGECPSLLNEDSGGDANLDMEIDAALKGSTP
jgi:hypothetical protein